MLQSDFNQYNQQTAYYFMPLYRKHTKTNEYRSPNYSNYTLRLCRRNAAISNCVMVKENLDIVKTLFPVFCILVLKTFKILQYISFYTDSNKIVPICFL